MEVSGPTWNGELMNNIWPVLFEYDVNTASAYKSLCLSNPAATVETNSFWDRKPFAGNKKKQNLKITY